MTMNMNEAISKCCENGRVAMIKAFLQIALALYLSCQRRPVHSKLSWCKAGYGCRHKRKRKAGVDTQVFLSKARASSKASYVQPARRERRRRVATRGADGQTPCGAWPCQGCAFIDKTCKDSHDACD
jgi:C4-dicarboxylate-specific signal transduction histidine kinase